jgi:hypothetical protein
MMFARIPRALRREERRQVSFHGERQGIKIIPTLQNGDDRGNSLHEVGELPEALSRKRHVREWIIPVGIKSGRHQQQARAKSLECGNDLVLKERDVGVLAGSCRKREIQRESLPGPYTSFMTSACPRIEGKLVDADVQNGRIIFEDVLCTVTMVDIPIEDGNPLDAMLMPGMACPDGHAVEEAKSHGFVPLGMVSGRPNGAERGARLAREYGIDRSHNTSGCEQSGIEGTLRDIRVARFVYLPSSPGRSFLQKINMLRRVNSPQLVVRRHCWRNVPEAVPKTIFLQPRHQMSQTLGALRMSCRWMMLKVEVIVNESDSVHDVGVP